MFSSVSLALYSGMSKFKMVTCYQACMPGKETFETGQMVRQIQISTVRPIQHRSTSTGIQTQKRSCSSSPWKSDDIDENPSSAHLDSGVVKIQCHYSEPEPQLGWTSAIDEMDRASMLINPILLVMSAMMLAHRSSSAGCQSSHRTISSHVRHA